MWIRRCVLAIPFFVAAVLTVEMVVCRQSHGYCEHLEGYGFLFAAPWVWFLDGIVYRLLPHHIKYPWLGYVIFLWLPAALYSVSLWLLFQLFRLRKKT
jgi:hypothetical protein